MPLKPFIPLVEPLRFPSPDGSKVYEVPPVGMTSGARLALDLDPKSDVNLSAEEEQQILLGPVLEQLRADDVPTEFFSRVFLTVYTDWSRGRAAAEVMWETGGDPKALEALTVQPESLSSTSTGEAPATPSPASTSSTTSSRKSSKRSPKAATSPGMSS